MSMTWKGPEALRLIRAEAGRRVDGAARVARDGAKALISRPQPVRIYGKKAGRSRAGLDPSKPGEPPKKVTGHLRINVRKEFDPNRVEARVGTNVPYGKHLELGTRKMAARPWLSATLKRKAGEIQRRFGIGVTL
jgi:hypothetical protein